MPYDEPDAEDPMMLVGVELPADGSALLESCRVFAEEFARMGFDEERLLQIFRDPFYEGPHRAYLALGEERVREIAREHAAVWVRFRCRDREVDPESGLISLPVLASVPGHDDATDSPERRKARRTGEE